MKSYTFDASALICYFDGEPNAVKVAALLDEINEKKIDSYLNVINLGEVYYHFLRTGGQSTAELVFSSLQTLPLTILIADTELTLLASGFKAFHRMSYADCFAAATAKVYNSTLITSDSDFKQVEKDIKVNWI